MDKIRVQFNEHEYQTYHNYCLRYYTVYDATRKRSIHLFLELFEKDIFPVGEDDLGEAYLFFSKKCDDLSADNNPDGKYYESTDLPGYQACRDIQILIGDFEKLYHIIQKSGISPNYLLILATFSKIIEDERNDGISATNEKDREKFESFIPGIADIIRKRLGPDAGWESALFELMRIVRKFNAGSPDQKIDRNCISLIGPAVVAHFDTSIGYEEIQSSLERFFEESEFSEFESLLNNTQYLPDNDAGSDISDSVIFEALKSISIRSIGSGYHEPVSDPHILKTMNTDLPAVIAPTGGYSDSTALTPIGRAFYSGNRKSQKNRASRFDIDVIDKVKSFVIMPKRGENFSFNRPTESGIPRYSMMFMGVIIFILFIITMAATSGIWNPVKPMDNMSPGTTGNISNTLILQKLAALQKDVTSLSALQKSPTQSAKTDSGSLVQNKKVTPVPSLTPKTALSSADINKHFFRIAFGPDNTKITKFPQDRISIAMIGDTDDNDTVTMGEFIDQFNNHSYTTKISQFIKSGNQASIVIYLLPEASLKNIEPLASSEISKDSKTGVIHYLHETVKKQLITTEIIYVNSDFKGDQRTHWMLRGLLYELGFPGETYDYPDSIFYSGSENTTRLMEIDMKAVELMYGKKITPGLTSDRVKSMLLL